MCAPDLDAEKAAAAGAATSEVRDGCWSAWAAAAPPPMSSAPSAAASSRGCASSASQRRGQPRRSLVSVGPVGPPFDDVARLDLTIDGADEIDPRLRAIKGGGGALLREKVVAAASGRVGIVVDSSKLVARSAPSRCRSRCALRRRLGDPGR